VVKSYNKSEVNITLLSVLNLLDIMDVLTMESLSHPYGKKLPRLLFCFLEVCNFVFNSRIAL
jgi:uncharacterized membrane protein